MDDRRKRMSMRSWRRGMKEMDLILGPWSDTHLADLGEGDLAAYDLLLEENDQELLAWMLGQRPIPEGPTHDLATRIAAFARVRFAKS
ncbi:succinate dehydrogenase assembly factor 2 [Falsirhodobacter halotolerans]|uniref:FAD assembly factor SdhE n=1 Tax=Falsirhodobacter halotolerans TaxID=1146892 RepID=UPI001FD352B4|nr:succinate dehydrogenase assembly factor 2 [Falsirhodobacter halotolerans]MCJ8139920.1 succinate dehydrogenase assembly factor 2 [Falsirhodobacter halotolerans]